MHWILLTALMAGLPAPQVVEIDARDAVQSLGELQTGTLLLSEGDCLAVRVFTQSSYTHVASVVVRDGQPFVYDSSNGAGVRCWTLENYLASQASAELHVLRPRKPFTEGKARQFQARLDSELGRPYAIKHHLTGERAEGLHCAEYATDALMACHLVRAEHPSRVSPASLAEGVLTPGLYTHDVALRIRRQVTPVSESASWCDRMWYDTKECTRGCYRKMAGWFCCS